MNKDQLIIEKDSVRDWMRRLSNFMDTLQYTDLPIEEQCRIDEQWDTLERLVRIMEERIENN